MKTIMIGNQYVGYKPISESIRDFAIYFPSTTSPKDLENWRDSAKHGEILKLPAEGFNSFQTGKKHLICINLD